MRIIDYWVYLSPLVFGNPHMPEIAMVAYASNMLQHHVGSLMPIDLLHWHALSARLSF